MKKLFYKITSSVLIISLSFSLSACGKKNNDIFDYGTETVASQEDAGMLKRKSLWMTQSIW